MENVIEIKVVPAREFFYSNDSGYGIYACETDTPERVMVNKRFNTFSMKGNTFRLQLDKEYNAKLVEKEDKKYGTYYEIVSIFENIPTDKDKQRGYLLSILTDRQVDSLYKAYPDVDIIQLVKDDKIDVKKVHGLGEKNYKKIRDKIVENLEFQQAFEFLSQYGVTNNLIIKLVKHFKSAGLLIGTLQNSPYDITAVSGVGFKKADAIAMSMGNDPNGKSRIQAAIEFVLQEQANNGHTYYKIDSVAELVIELINVDEQLIYECMEETDNVKLIEDKICLKKFHKAERRIANRIKELLEQSTELDFEPDKFIKEQEEKRKMTLTEQQRQFFFNIKKSNVNILTGFAGCGKSAVTGLLIDLLEELHIPYRLLSPTGKAAKVLSGYTNRYAETIHRATGHGLPKEEQDMVEIAERFVIVDEHSMVDVILCDQLLRKCVHEDLRLLFVGDPFQIPSVSAGNVLHDMLSSGIIPTTKLDIVFRQKEGGIIDVATKIRLGEKFLSNSDTGIFEFGDNCVVASVPQEKVEGGYRYYFNQLLEKYSSDEITIVTPTKKSNLGTVEINKHIQGIINPSSEGKAEKKYGIDGVVFKEKDLVLNTKNTKIEDIINRKVDIVNGDIGKIVKIDNDEEEIHIDFGFAVVPIGFGMLNQIIHAWGITMHKMQGSSNKTVIAIADKAHKFQMNANLLYTAVTRPEEYLVIVSQAETINYAMKKIANLQRNTFLCGMLKGEEVTVE
ncbi:AAA family ATPase [Bacillus sp. T33-2]|uniref:AAA family ATPase n=1 Tax=Bacillus sp. T33-2 TaxID=2054168 RepID=UPI000C759033|nr:AAA family ATPase [Bacillus sp. T33-2]PLR99621.1 hypothetical protein CVD19_00740 [Bacillus sp. T33-2]